MRKVIIALAIATSLTSFYANALEVAGIATVGSSLIGSTTLRDFICEMDGDCKEALQVVQDTQDYNQTGILSAFLEQKIQETKASNKNLSDEDALDAVVTSALAQLK